MEDFEKTIDENLAFWVNYIELNGQSGPGATNQFDMARSIQWLLFDMVCRLFFGSPIGFVEKHHDCHSFQRTLEERLPIVEKFAVLTEMNALIKVVSYLPLVRRLLPSSRDQAGIGAILGVKSSHALIPSQPCLEI